MKIAPKKLRTRFMIVKYEFCQNFVCVKICNITEVVDCVAKFVFG